MIASEKCLTFATMFVLLYTVFFFSSSLSSGRVYSHRHQHKYKEKEEVKKASHVSISIVSSHFISFGTALVLFLDSSRWFLNSPIIFVSMYLWHLYCFLLFLYKMIVCCSVVVLCSALLCNSNS